MSRANGLALLACALASASVGLARVADPGGAPWFEAGFAVALAWRLLAGRDGGALLPRRALALLLGLLLAAALPYLLHLAGGGGADFFAGVLGTLTCFLGVALLAPLGAFGAFWVVLLCSTQVAVAASLSDQPLGAGLLVLCVALLACTLLGLERATAGSAPRSQRLVDPGSRPRLALAGAALRLVSLGLVLGGLVWLVAPRPGPAGAGGRERPVWDTEAGETAARHGAAGGSTEAQVGPDESPGDDAVLGAVDRIQKDNRVHVEVRLLEGSEEPAVLLREAVRDLWLDARGSTAGRWRSSRSLDRDRLPTESDGWTIVGAPVEGRAERVLEATFRLGSRLVFLEPDAHAFRVERPGDPAGGVARLLLRAETRRLGSTRLERRLLPGDVVVMRGQPQPRGGRDLAGRESSARVAPLTSYAQIEPALAARLRGLCEGVPGTEQGADAWQRAQALERWLQGPDFQYELASPALASGRRVEDFLTRVKRGNCEWYATALTLLLRAHGHAARYAQGYWGGSHTPGSGLWSFHGTSYHAWTELFLDGVGWVPLNPTPPERLAALADETTAAAGRGAAREDQARGPALSERLRGAAAAAGRWLGETWKGRHGAWPRAALLAAALAIVAWATLALRRARGGAARVTPGREAGSALGEALALLARRGFPRPAGWTAREYLARTGAGLKPEAQSALARLTQRHEQRSYAGGQEPPEPDRDDLKSLAAALRREAR